MNNKNAIVDYINKPFNFDTKEFEKLNWSTKMVLSGNSENFHGGKFADLEFCYKKANGEDNRIEHKTITFTKEDINVLLKEMYKIKENLNKISSIKEQNSIVFIIVNNSSLIYINHLIIKRKYLII